MNILAEHLRAARVVLAQWDVDVAAVERVSVSENIAFRVEDRAHRPYVLRLHRPGYHTLPELVSEQTWTKALVASGINAPVPVATRSGGGFSFVEVAGERRAAGLLEWVPGEMLHAAIDGEREAAAQTGIAKAEDCFAALGAAMAAIHNHAAAWPIPERFHRHALDADGLMGEQPFWGRFWESPHLTPAQRRRLDALRRRLHDALRTYGKDRGTYSLIHADLHPGNVVVNGQRLHIIDFDDAGFGWHQYDIAVALYHYRDHPQFPRWRDALVAGYRSLRPIDDTALQLLTLFLLARSLVSIGWVAARPEHDAPGTTAWHMEHVEKSADAVLRDLG